MTRRTAIQGTALFGLGGLFNTVKASDGTTSSETQPNPRAVAQDVRREFRWAWKKYEKYAWGHDHLESVTGSYRRRLFDEDLTIVESLDTLYLLGLDRELERAIEWIENELTFDVDYNMSVFEGTIRYVGGPLSGYKVTGNEILLQRAQDFADRLYPTFEQSPSGCPTRTSTSKRGKSAVMSTSSLKSGHTFPNGANSRGLSVTTGTTLLQRVHFERCTKTDQSWTAYSNSSLWDTHEAENV